MGVETSQVFVVPGRTVSGEGAKASGEVIEHYVVVAADGQKALQVLGNEAPTFMPLGFTSLKEFEDAVVKVRQTLAGAATGWPMVIDPSMG
jgi:hypothetical protein